MITLMERLGVNVISVVIGAMFFLIAIAWVEALRYLAEYVYFHEGGIKDYHTLQKKFLGAIFVSVLSAFLIIIIYCVYKNSSTGKKVDSKEIEPHVEKSGLATESFPGIPGTAPEMVSDFSGADVGVEFDDIST